MGNPLIEAILTLVLLKGPNADWDRRSGAILSAGGYHGLGSHYWNRGRDVGSERTCGPVGTAREVTLDELRVELVFPRNEEAEAFFRLGAEAELEPA